jgi:hypothetical protein
MKEKKMGKRQEKRENAKRKKIATFFFPIHPPFIFHFPYFFILIWFFILNFISRLFLTIVSVAFEPTKSTGSY